MFDEKNKNDTLLGIFRGSRRPFIVQTSGQFMRVTFQRYHELGFFNFEGVYSSASKKGENMYQGNNLKLFEENSKGEL